LALLCACPVPNLPLTVFPGAAGAAINEAVDRAAGELEARGRT
jgi:hypothetical protein